MALNGFNIAEFKANALRNGLLKHNLYLVNFQQSGFLSNSLMFFTENVSIPATDLDTQMIRRYGYGPIENVPFRPVFQPLRMTFIVEASQQNVLINVLKNISATTSFMNYNNMSTQGETLLGGRTIAYPYEVAYKGDLEFDLTVYVYNDHQDTIMTYTFKQCYAKQVGDISLGWATNDQYMKVDVVFMYTDYSINSETTTQINDLSSLSNIQSQLGFSSPSQTISALQYPVGVSDAINLANARTLVGLQNNPAGNYVSPSNSSLTNQIQL